MTVPGLMYVHRRDEDPFGVTALSAVMTPEMVLAAYAEGLFPWEGRAPIPWCSLPRRCVMDPAAFTWRRSLRKSLRKHQWAYRIDGDFEAVMRACAAPRAYAEETWITEEMVSCYRTLFESGSARCIEVLDAGRLVGGLYGLTIGRAFFGESMFHRVTDASKAAFGCLCSITQEEGNQLIDCQAVIPHLLSLGAVDVSREEYLQQLADALR